MLDAFLTAFRSGISLNLASLGVSAALITDWNTDRFYDIGGESYQAVDFTVQVDVYRSATYTS